MFTKMKNFFQKIENNSLWELYGETIVVYKTSWKLIDLYPMVYYYHKKDMNKRFPFLRSIPRTEFLMYAKNIKNK